MIGWLHFRMFQAFIPVLHKFVDYILESARLHISLSQVRWLHSSICHNSYQLFKDLLVNTFYYVLGFHVSFSQVHSYILDDARLPKLLFTNTFWLNSRICHDLHVSSSHFLVTL